MKNTCKLFILLVVLVTIQKDVKAQLQYSGFGCSTGVTYLKHVPKYENGIHIRYFPVTNLYKGIIIRCEDPSMDVGVGLTTINLEQEIQGVFPETNSFGLAYINTIVQYWTIPIVYRFVSRNSPRISLSYIPSIMAYSKQNIQKLGGATESNIVNMSDNLTPFQHSFIFSLNIEIGHRRGPLLLCANPYFGISSDYLKDQKPTFSNITAGMNVNLLFDFTSISISRTTNNNSTYKKKEDELRKKQEEIQKKLNKK